MAADHVRHAVDSDSMGGGELDSNVFVVVLVARCLRYFNLGGLINPQCLSEDHAQRHQVRRDRSCKRAIVGQVAELGSLRRQINDGTVSPTRDIGRKRANDAPQQLVSRPRIGGMLDCDYCGCRHEHWQSHDLARHLSRVRRFGSSSMVYSSTLRGWCSATGRRVSICRLSGEAIALKCHFQTCRGALTTGSRAPLAGGRCAFTHACLKRDVTLSLN